MWRRAAVLALCALFAVQVYRAATQSITVDEARVYIDFIRPDPPALLNQYEAAHHVLQTYLSWLFVKAWGGSEIVLRIPALLACLAYFAFAYRFSVRLFSGGPLLFAAVLALASNVLILDHLSLARGYGVALALFAWAFLAAMDRRLFAAGILSGLAVAANLTFLIPVCALAVVITLTGPRHRTLLTEYAGPAFVTGALLLMLPLSHVDPARHFYYGAYSLGETARHLVEGSFGRWSAAGAVIAVAAIALSAAAGSSTASLTFSISLVAVVAGHVLLNVRYPLGRTGLWGVFLITAAALSGIAALKRRSRWWGFAGTALCAAAAALSLAHYTPKSTGEWAFNKSTKRFMTIIRDREHGRNRPFLVSGHEEYKFPADYYRVRFNLSNMKEFPFGDPRSGADYFLFYGDRRYQDAERFHAAIIEEDRSCESLVAAR